MKRSAVWGVTLLLGSGGLVGCSVEPSVDAVAVACADYMEVKGDLLETYTLMSKVSTGGAMLVHVEKLEEYAEQVSGIADGLTESGADSELADGLAAMGEKVAQTAMDMRQMVAGGSDDALKKTSAEMIYVEKGVLETCGAASTAP